MRNIILSKLTIWHEQKEGGLMVSIFDVAEYILDKTGPLSTMKLQKIVYYSQAWSLVWDDEPLFGEKIEAWVNGPVIPALFFSHRGEYKVGRGFSGCGDPGRLSEEQKNTIDGVVEFYGPKSAQWLSDLTHSEDPWKDARKGLPAGERGDSEITLESMAIYYGGLQEEA